MKRLWRVGAFGWLGVALLVPVLLAQVVEDDIGIEIGKAASAEAQMEIAREKHFTERDYPGAIEAYDEVVNLFPTSDEAPEALFRVGNIHHWRLIDPAEAITSYHRLVDTYPESDFAKEAWIRIGEAYGRDDRWRDALSAFQEAVDRHPGTDYATWALLEIASTHYSDLADPATAAPMYETVQRDAPGTRYAGEARLRLSVMAYLAGGIAQDEAVLRCRTVADGAADDALLRRTLSSPSQRSSPWRSAIRSLLRSWTRSSPWSRTCTRMPWR